MSERMLRRGGPLAEPDADEQQNAVEVSTVEWNPSDSMAELPVMPATTNFVAAIPTLAAIAP
jgi:hypothetical protein